METQSLWYKLGFWLFSQPAETITRGFNTLSVERLKAQDKNHNGRMELEEYLAAMKEAFPGNPLSKISVCEIDKETLALLTERHGQSKEAISRDISEFARSSYPENHRIADVALSSYLLRFKEAFPKGFDAQTPDCNLVGNLNSPSNLSTNTQLVQGQAIAINTM